MPRHLRTSFAPLSAHHKHIAHHRGTDHDDVLISRGNFDVLHGRYGDDVLVGRGSANTLFGGPGDDVLIGGNGHNPNPTLFYGDRGNDTYVGGAGDDMFFFNGGLDVVRKADADHDYVSIDVGAYFPHKDPGVTSIAHYDMATGLLSLQEDASDGGSPTVIIGQFEPGFNLRDTHIFYDFLV